MRGPGTWLAWGLIAALAGCDEPLAERCDFDHQCGDHEVCSNGGDRRRSGFCVPEPDAAPPDMAVPDAATTDGGTDASM